MNNLTATDHQRLRDRVAALEAALIKIRDMPVGEFRPLTAEIEIWNIARAALTANSGGDEHGP